MNVMNTKALLATLVLAASGLARAATNDPQATLERGLFEEEANHNLPAAIQAYEAVVAQFDNDRKLAATAVFRLGECYRRQGDTNAASAQYARVLREFADQDPLATLSRQNLLALGASLPSAGSVSDAGRQEQKRLLQEEIALVEKKLDAQHRQIEVGAVNQDALWATQRELLELKRQAAALDAGAPITIPLAADSAAPPTSDEAEEVRRIQAMIKDSPDLINAHDKSGKTPLHGAAEQGQLVVAGFLLQNGADIDSRDHLEATPLWEAAANGRKAMVELLLNHKAALELADRNGLTPLHEAARKGFISVVQVLLAHGANPNARAKDGSTALHAAVGAGQPAVVEVLLAQKADVNAAREDGMTPLHLAAQAGLESIAKQLLDHGADLNAKDNLRATPLAVAVEHAQLPVARLLLKRQADPNGEFDLVLNSNNPREKWSTTPLHQAVSQSNLEMLKLLLENGANPNIQSHGHTPLLLAVLNQKQDLAALLLRHGADPNIADEQGSSPLHFAVKQPPVMELLLSAKAAVNATNNWAQTVLYWAVGAELQPAAELLLKHGANPNLPDKNGITPLHLAVLRRNKDLTDLLLANGADPNIRNNGLSTPLDWARNGPAFSTTTMLGGISLPWGLSLSPGSPGIPLSMGRNSTGPDQAGIAALLKSHGAIEELPDFSSIRITRSGRSQPLIVFRSSTNRANHFTLLEVIACISSPPGSPGSISSPGFIPFLDLTRILIHRPDPAHPAQHEDLKAALLSASGGLDCSKDVPLQFGDVIEIPEREHSLAERADGLSQEQRNDLEPCLSRKVSFVVKGHATEVTLYGRTGDTYLSQAMRAPAIQAILLSSSDLTAVRVKRTDAATHEVKEFTQDVRAFWNGSQLWTNDLWLRDGDVVEVPEQP